MPLDYKATCAMAAGVRDRTAARRRRLTLSGSLASQTLSVPQRRALSAFSMRADIKAFGAVERKRFGLRDNFSRVLQLNARCCSLCKSSGKGYLAWTLRDYYPSFQPNCPFILAAPDN